MWAGWHHASLSRELLRCILCGERRLGKGADELFAIKSRNARAKPRVDPEDHQLICDSHKGFPAPRAKISRARTIRELDIKRIAASFHPMNRHVIGLTTRRKPGFARIPADKPCERPQVAFCARCCTRQKMPIGGVKSITAAQPDAACKDHPAPAPTAMVAAIAFRRPNCDPAGQGCPGPGSASRLCIFKQMCLTASQCKKASCQKKPRDQNMRDALLFRRDGSPPLGRLDPPIASISIARRWRRWSRAGLSNWLCVRPIRRCSNQHSTRQK